VNKVSTLTEITTSRADNTETVDVNACEVINESIEVAHAGIALHCFGNCQPSNSASQEGGEMDEIVPFTREVLGEGNEQENIDNNVEEFAILLPREDGANLNLNTIRSELNDVINKLGENNPWHSPTKQVSRGWKAGIVAETMYKMCIRGKQFLEC